MEGWEGSATGMGPSSPATMYVSLYCRVRVEGWERSTTRMGPSSPATMYVSQFMCGCRGL